LAPEQWQQSLCQGSKPIQTVSAKEKKEEKQKKFPTHIRHSFKILFWSDLFLTIFDAK
jgi:hypothetical protein